MPFFSRDNYDGVYSVAVPDLVSAGGLLSDW